MVVKRVVFRRVQRKKREQLSSARRVNANASRLNADPSVQSAVPVAGSCAKRSDQQQPHSERPCAKLAGANYAGTNHAGTERSCP